MKEKRTPVKFKKVLVGLLVVFVAVDYVTFFTGSNGTACKLTFDKGLMDS